MIIRKLFDFEAAHIVRNCSSDRCKKSIHGHSFKVEVFLESKFLDNAGMVYDFGLMKGTIKSFLDSFDHCYILWNKESDEFKSFIKSNSVRWVELPFSPSAEQLSLFFHLAIQDILDRTRMMNGERGVKVKAVRVHETATGYAESEIEDAYAFKQYIPKGYYFPDHLSEELRDSVGDLWNFEFAGNSIPVEIFLNPEVEQQKDSESKSILVSKFS